MVRTLTPALSQGEREQHVCPTAPRRPPFPRREGGQGVRFVLVAALLTSLGALAQIRALRRYRQIPALAPDPSHSGDRPLVSIVVPARNEEENLRVLMPSLVGLDYEPREVIVVDDDSTDATARVAAAHGARVISTQAEPPNGWIGKTWAMERGFREARGEWLLFVDADVWLAPECVGAAMAAARAQRLDALSIFPDQRCVEPGERLLLPFAFAGYFAGVGRDVNTCPGDALLNGQFVLVRRSTYEAIGGHRQVAGSVVEDVALGKVLLRSGYRVGIYRAAGLASVRMYRSTAGLLEGFGKNAFGMVRLLPARGARITLATTLASTSGSALAAGLLAALRAARRGDRTGSLAALLPATFSYGLAVAAQAGWSREFGAPRIYGLLQPLAALGFLAIALRSAAFSLGGLKVKWKGRMYRS
jgi:chlorobactene glucosyltransferase